MHAPSKVAVGTVIGGSLNNTVRAGAEITFSDNTAQISDVRKVEEQWGDLFIHTDTSTYRLHLEKPPAGTEDFDLEDIDTVETAKGSTYRYLPDGSTQRFKKVEGREYEKQSALVYVPDWAWVKQNASPEVLAKLGGDEDEYVQTLLRYVQNPVKSMDRKVYIVDEKGKRIETNQEIKEAEGTVYLIFLSKGNPDFFIPVSHKPKLGFMTFDTRKYDDKETGEPMRERHLGNPVVKILRKSEKGI